MGWPIILHFDLDAFYCAVEEQKSPELKGLPFAVGGTPDGRGVVASCSYAARRFGVRSAMPTAQALRLCPSLKLVPGSHQSYGDVSSLVMTQLDSVTPLVEQVSIDEAFLDVTGSESTGETIAQQLQSKINRDLDLPCSLGVATSKLVAKIANNVGKASAQTDLAPNTINVVESGQEEAFLAPLPIDALWGVGPKTAESFRNLGVDTIGDVTRSRERILERFGDYGRRILDHARGLDNRSVEIVRESKSHSHETTFSHDINDPQILEGTLLHLSESVGRDLRKSGISCRTVTLKYRRADFSTSTRSITLDEPVNLDRRIFEEAGRLFRNIWKDREYVRLLGVSASNLLSEGAQLQLWDGATSHVQEAIDSVRGKFGNLAVRWGKEQRRDTHSTDGTNRLPALLDD
jgi:DNA polymerase-4